MFWSALQSLPRPLPRKTGRGRGGADHRRRSALAVELLEARLVPTIFVVKNNMDSGTDSLRQAITNANNAPGANAVTFAITGSTTIQLATVLPTITKQVLIDGTTQAGGSHTVELDGTRVGNPTTNPSIGLHVGPGGGGSVIRGLTINRFATGIFLEGSGNTIAGNFIGTDVTGTISRPNTSNGIDLIGSNNNLIGGLSFQDRNVISGNGENGIRLQASGNNTIQGNFIGTQFNGPGNLGNGQNGVLLTTDPPPASRPSNSNKIGGSEGTAGNIIAFNRGNGVLVAAGNNNSILHNSIYQNQTPSGGGAGIGGANLPRGPIISSAVTDGTVIDLAGTFQGPANTNFIIEFFQNTVCDPSGSGQGESFLGSQNVRTDNQGTATLTPSFTINVPLNRFITATGTVVESGTPPVTSTTSRFSPCLSVAAATHAVQFSIVVNPPAPPTVAGTTFSITVTAVNFAGNVATDYTGPIHFTSSDLIGVLPGDYSFTPADQGRHVFQVTLKKAGVQTITAEGSVSLPNRTLIIRGTTSVQVNPAAASTLTLALAPNQNVAVGNGFKVVVTAQDPFGNTATGYRGTIRFSSNDRNATIPNNYTFLPGDVGTHQFDIILATAGRRTITVTDISTPSLTATLLIPLPLPASSTTLSSAPNPSSLGQPVTFTAIVAGGGRRGTATGTVTFIEGRAVLGSGTLNSDGVATFTTATLSIGRHTVTAVYGGDDNFSDSTSFALDQDVGDPGTVFTANERFVRQLYLDVLHRPVDVFGMGVWVGLLDQGHSRTEIAQTIINSRENRVQMVQTVYSSYLHRSADAFGLNAWISFLNAGGTLEQFEALVVASPEYFQARGGGSNDGFLAALYQDALGRGIDPVGQVAFGGALAAGQASRSQVAQLIFTSTEFQQDLVNILYRQYLHRDADDIGLMFFVGSLQRGARDENVAAALIGSDEYFSKV
jgi:hypothetical protein